MGWRVVEVPRCDGYGSDDGVANGANVCVRLGRNETASLWVKIIVGYMVANMSHEVDGCDDDGDN